MKPVKGGLLSMEPMFMKLWTYHPITFRPNDPNGKIDPRKGMCWGNSSLRYRQALPRLHELLGTDQFLWCWTTRGSRSSKEVCLLLHEWKLEVPLSEILAFCNIPIWDEIVDGKGEAWDRLFVEKTTAVAEDNLAAWVRFPLRECLITCLGRPTGH